MRRTRIKPVSDKRRQVNRARRKLAADHLDEPCRLHTPVCTGWAEHFHELVSRGQGGSLTDGRNLVPSCDACNGWVEDNLQEAYMRGVRYPSWESQLGVEGRVPDPANVLAIAWDDDRGAA